MLITHAQFSNIVLVASEALPTITENTATLLSEAQRQDDDRDPFAHDCCIIYFHYVHLAAQVTGINVALALELYPQIVLLEKNSSRGVYSMKYGIYDSVMCNVLII